MVRGMFVLVETVIIETHGIVILAVVLVAMQHGAGRGVITVDKPIAHRRTRRRAVILVATLVFHIAFRRRR